MRKSGDKILVQGEVGGTVEVELVRPMTNRELKRGFETWDVPDDDEPVPGLWLGRWPDPCFPNGLLHPIDVPNDDACDHQVSTDGVCQDCGLRIHDDCDCYRDRHADEVFEF